MFLHSTKIKMFPTLKDICCKHSFLDLALPKDEQITTEGNMTNLRL